METTSIRADEINREWFIVDAEGQTLGRLASEIAQIIRGKKKPFYTPHMDMGDFVVVVNAEKVKVTGNKEKDKSYFRHSGFPGGVTQISLQKVRQDFPERIITNAVKGMLPHNRLGRQLLTHLKVYSGTEHPHGAQLPKTITFN
ncbi:MAG TPA: 50S ribosomal protein L13 [Candidatus Marinimicrobia bacterium]|jgi:large subunit ribosomal protein L13|nr:50S ribosomal protein L13 [Candidatus Neomarinimicrobiota bacterium]MDP7027228.1 50S ribosomal protein L13 [Candidatus Neomarinimicrobiota bacterium]MDP7465307.1 50S ribosomal protein L13 [Candidatus Neomarinimicrobiota bacterium]HJM84164.1 50S ribosomal protein L13 [Candidatus Neomarinimicrobiota bacterium]|tara:strand:+ start:176 stop:607 length:432 start_codon:yes stop_codon:yes gene_type:complete